MFIEFNLSNHSKLLVDVNAIEFVDVDYHAQNRNGKLYISLSSGDGFSVEESYEEVKELLERAGKTICK